MRGSDLYSNTATLAAMKRIECREQSKGRWVIYEAILLIIIQARDEADLDQHGSDRGQENGQVLDIL